MKEKEFDLIINDLVNNKTVLEINMVVLVVLNTATT